MIILLLCLQKDVPVQQGDGKKAIENLNEADVRIVVMCTYTSKH